MFINTAYVSSKPLVMSSNDGLNRGCFARWAGFRRGINRPDRYAAWEPVRPHALRAQPRMKMGHVRFSVLGSIFTLGLPKS